MTVKVRHYTLKACENCEAHASVSLTLKSVLLLNSSRNNSSVADVPSQYVTPFKVLSTDRSAFSHSAV